MTNKTENPFFTWHRKYTYVYNLMPEEHKNKIIDRYNKVPGYINDTQIVILHLISSLSDAGILVEIGSYQGRSTIIFADSNPDLRVFAVDTFDGGNDMGSLYKNKNIKDIYTNNIQLASVRNVSVFCGTSQAAAETAPDNALNYVFIDGSHLYNDVKNDILSWTPKLKIGGLMFGHDYGLTPDAEPVGVRRAVHEYVKFNDSFIRFGEICGIWGAIKIK